MKSKIITTRRNNSLLSKGLITVLAVLALFICMWSVLSVVARQKVKKRLAMVESHYNIDIQCQAVLLNGLRGVNIKDITFTPAGSSLKLHAQSFMIRTGLLTPSVKENEIKAFEIYNLDVYYTPKTSQKNSKNNNNDSPDYASVVKDVFGGLSNIFPNLPPSVSIYGMRIIYKDAKGKESVYNIPSLNITDNYFVARIENDDKKAQNYWICKGSYTQRTSKLNFRLYRENSSSPAQLPLIKKLCDATVKLDTLFISLQQGKSNGNVQVIRGQIGVKGFSLDHPSLSYDPVFFDKGIADFKLNIGKNYIEVDSNATNVRYKRLQFHPYILLAKNKDWRIKVALDKNYFPASDFFDSFPTGLFNNLEGIKVSGALSYHLFFDVDMGRIDDLVFESNAQTRNFSIISFGKTDLDLMSSPFMHSVYDNGKKIRDIEVGEDNPNFTPIKKLPRNLLQAVLFAEDYSFYSHKGFYDEAFRKSLIENLKAKHFVRGASTLTMQVVKNVFLGHNKLLSRKFEEILIVWLIENNNLTSKQRMFEVYLNVIEWGPNIYGITEASRYYFIKEPSALTLSECIFLAYVIPSPKKLKENFHGMRPNKQYYEFFDDVLKRMKKRGIINSGDVARANPAINLRGAVVNHLSNK